MTSVVVEIHPPIQITEQVATWTKSDDEGVSFTQFAAKIEGLSVFVREWKGSSVVFWSVTEPGRRHESGKASSVTQAMAAAALCAQRMAA